MPALFRQSQVHVCLHALVYKNAPYIASARAMELQLKNGAEKRLRAYGRLMTPPELSPDASHRPAPPESSNREWRDPANRRSGLERHSSRAEIARNPARRMTTRPGEHATL